MAVVITQINLPNLKARQEITFLEEQMVALHFSNPHMEMIQFIWEIYVDK